MKDIFVCGRKEISQFVYAHEITHIVSLHESLQEVKNSIPVTFPRDNWLFIQMEDTEDSSVPGAPKLSDIKEVFEFIDIIPDDAIVLVHCEAGMSRSTAMFIAISAYTKRGTLDEIWDDLIDKRKIVIPNELILNMASDLVEEFLPDILEYNNLSGILINANH